ncbi:hypothetical protein MRX96_030391, partial [Rhipicephalus microplus]
MVASVLPPPLKSGWLGDGFISMLRLASGVVPLGWSHWVFQVTSYAWRHGRSGKVAESLLLLPLPGLDRRRELEGLDASADHAGLVETSVSAGLLRVGGRLLSCFIDVEGVAFMFFKVFDISRSGLGKSTLINTLFKANISRRSCTKKGSEGTEPAPYIIPKTTEVKSVSH